MWERFGRSFLILVAGILIGWGGAAVSNKSEEKARGRGERSSINKVQRNQSTRGDTERTRDIEPSKIIYSQERDPFYVPVEVREISEDWVKRLKLAKREEVNRALEEIRQALAKGSDPEAWAAIKALATIKNLNIDKSGLRSLVLDQLGKGGVSRRTSSHWALYAIGATSEDIERLKGLGNDLDMQHSMTVLLGSMDPDGLSGESGDFIAELLSETDDPTQIGRIVSGLTGSRFSEDLEKSLLHHSRNEDSRVKSSLLYHGLRRINPKSTEVTERLLEYLSESDQSAWGHQFQKATQQ